MAYKNRLYFKSLSPQNTPNVAKRAGHNPPTDGGAVKLRQNKTRGTEMNKEQKNGILAKFKYTLVYYFKNGEYGINYYDSKEKAEKHLEFYLHNSNYASAKIYERKGN